LQRQTGQATLVEMFMGFVKSSPPG
jgi:hypothetical protein